MSVGARVAVGVGIVGAGDVCAGVVCGGNVGAGDVIGGKVGTGTLGAVLGGVWEVLSVPCTRLAKVPLPLDGVTWAAGIRVGLAELGVNPRELVKLPCPLTLE